MLFLKLSPCTLLVIYKIRFLLFYTWYFNSLAKCFIKIHKSRFSPFNDKAKKIKMFWFFWFTFLLFYFFTSFTQVITLFCNHIVYSYKRFYQIYIVQCFAVQIFMNRTFNITISVNYCKNDLIEDYAMFTTIDAYLRFCRKLLCSLAEA